MTAARAEAPRRIMLPYPAAELVLGVDATRPEWLAARKLGIGGSDVAALKGDSNYGTAYSVWADKTGRADEQRQTARMRAGQVFESGIATLFAEQSGLDVQPAPGLLRSREFPHLLLTPDYLIPSKRAGLEIKFTTSSKIVRQLEAGEIPANWWWQMVTYLLGSGLDAWYLGAYSPFRDDVIRRVIERRDVQHHLDTLGPFIEEWWTTYVAWDIPPDDGAPLLEPVQAGENDEVQALVPSLLLRDRARMLEIANLRDELAVEEVEINGRLAAELAGHRYLVADGKRIARTVRSNGRGKFDRKALKKDHPDIEAKYASGGTPYSYVQFIDPEES